MKPYLTTQGEQLTLDFGACTAQFSWAEAEAFRASLVDCLEDCLQQAPPKTATYIKQLNQLRPLAEALSSLENLALQTLLQEYPRTQLVSLIRYLRCEQPGVSEKIFSLLSRQTARQLTQDLDASSPLPLHQVLPALMALEQPLAQQGVYIGINQKARDYLQRLGQLPQATLEQLIKRLPHSAQDQLLTASQQLNLPDIEQACRQYHTQTTQANTQAASERLNEQAMYSLMALVSQEFKRLREASNGSSHYARSH